MRIVAKLKLPGMPINNDPILCIYITLLMYYGFLFVNIDKLDSSIDKMQLYLIGVYPISDWSLFFFSWCLQRNIMARRDQLFAFKSENVKMEKK